MVFERLFGSRKQRLSTIEPRFMYLYVPYRDQDDLPVFDTEMADLNLVQLFRTNRYVGGDRLGDANQVAIGFTSRWLDADTGEQYIAATVGQAYYFDRPRVTAAGRGARRCRDLRHHRRARSARLRQLEYPAAAFNGIRARPARSAASCNSNTSPASTGS